MALNPIVRKELLLTARQKSTYWVRAGLPVAAAVVLGVRICFELGLRGPDWQQVARLSRMLFETSCWLQLAVLCALVFFLTAASVSKEWTGRTMELLLVTPLSGVGVLLGKFVAALVTVLMAALALLPFSAVLAYAAHVPWEVVVGSFAVIVASVLFVGAVALNEGVLPSAKAKRWYLRFLSPFLWVMMLSFLLWSFPALRYPQLTVVLPPWALHAVLTGTRTGGLNPGAFALMSFICMVALTGLLLAAARWRLTYKLEWRLASSTAAALESGPAGKLASKRPRPPMGPDEDPFYWQARTGKQLRSQVVTICLMLGMMALLFFLLDVLSPGPLGRRLGSYFPLRVLAVQGFVFLLVYSAIYGQTVFAQEKARRTAVLLVLTGNEPAAIFRAKVRALYWVFRYVLVVIVLACFTGFVHLTVVGGVPPVPAFVGFVFVVELLLAGPGLLALSGMASSVVSMSRRRGTVTQLAEVAWLVLLGWPFYFLVVLSQPMLILCYSALFLAALLVLLRAQTGQEWSAWQFGALGGLCLLVIVGTMAALALFAFRLGWEHATWAILLVGFGANVLAGAYAGLWWHLGTQFFDAGMLAEPTGRTAGRAS